MELIAIAKAIAILAMVLVPVGGGLAAHAVFSAIGRNPKLENSLFTKLIIAIALIEVTAIFALVAFFTIG